MKGWSEGRVGAAEGGNGGGWGGSVAYRGPCTKSLRKTKECTKIVKKKKKSGRAASEKRTNEKTHKGGMKLCRE